ncbi:MAG: hypothetical protein LBE12_07345 [Planctomycetaceae bacterium]|nr:hypothetical protein [Planctomycetaceae bacterium]
MVYCSGELSRQVIFRPNITSAIADLTLFRDGNLCCRAVWNPVASRKPGQVGEYADAMAGESPSAKHDLPFSYCFFGVSHKNSTDILPYTI